MQDHTVQKLVIFLMDRAYIVGQYSGEKGIQ